MAVAFVQAKASAEGSSVASLAVTFDSSTVSANLVHVSTCVWDGDGAAPTGYTVTDNKSNTYSSCSVGQSFTESSGQERLEAHYAGNITGGAAHEITVSPGDTGLYMTIGVLELSGADVTTPLGNVNSATGSSAAPSSGSVTPGSAGLFVAGMGYESSTAGGSTMTPEAGWDQRLEIDENFDAAPQNIMTKAASNGVADVADWTQGATEAWGAYLVHYKEAAGGGGGDAVPVCWGQYRRRHAG